VGQGFYRVARALGRSPDGLKFFADPADGMDMFAPRFPLVLAALTALVACKSTPVPDLVLNTELYAMSGYSCKLPGDRSVFVTPVADARDQVVVADAAEGKYPVLYDTDARWHRPIAEMVDEVLRREVEESGIFDEITDAPKEAQIVVTPTIVAFRTGAVEELAGGRAIAEVAIRFQVHGPAGKDGVRERRLAVSVMHDENDNGKMDSNFLGIPLEGYATSNNVPHSMSGPPRFKDAEFEIRETPAIVQIKMLY